ncbi:DUF2339 domain-containing protein [Fodinibacter luteus]|uniref:DUF2339 domain-containing protein n=1 Tax=Fodinibacter luteus TaxID=552064 RepID=A0ABP8JY22_9MICO
MSQRTTVHQLEADFADAMTRLYAIGNGLARLRIELDREAGAPMAAPAAAPAPTVRTGVPGIPTASAAAPAPTVRTGVPGIPTPPTGRPEAERPDAGSVTFSPTPHAPAGVPPTPAWVPSTPPGHPAVPWYRREGAVTKVLALAGAVVTMAGVAMLLVLAVQQGWFGPQARVAAGAALAVVLAALGARGGEADRRDGATVGSAPVALVATGAAAAYLDVVAVTSGYGWMPAGAGLVLAGFVAVGGLFLARRWDSELLAALMVLGAAVLAPVVAGGGGWVVTAFLGILCVVGWWAGGSRTRPVLTLARVVPVTLALLVGAVTATPGGGDDVGTVAVAVAVLLITLATSTVSVRRDGRDASASAAVALLASGLLATLAPLADPARTTVLALTAAVLLLTAATLGRRPIGPLATHLVATVGIAGTVFAVLAVLSGAPERFTATGLLLLALVGLSVAGVTRSRLALGLAAGTSAVALLAWTPHALAALTASAAAGHDLAVALLDSALVGGVVAVGLWATAAQRGLGRELRLGVTVLGWVLALAASATALVSLGTLVGVRLGDPVLGFTVGHAVATVTWMLAAAWLLLRGLERSRDADLTLRTGLLLAGVAVAKLFLYDLAALSGLVRSVAFIVTGLLLLATGSRYARAYERSRRSA